MGSNPKAALDAIVSKRKPLTLARLAVFEKIDSPVMGGDISKIEDCIVAMWCYYEPYDVVVANLDDRLACALEWAEKLTPTEYGEKLTEMIGAIVAFYEMMPPADEQSKKKDATTSATGGSANCVNGSAERTNGSLRKCFMKLTRCISRFFTDATRKGKVA